MTGIELINEERRRQIEDLGWDAANDAVYTDHQLLNAAMAYILATVGDELAHDRWPWDRSWWKPGDKLRNLAKAGALIAGEIDRLLAERSQGE